MYKIQLESLEDFHNFLNSTDSDWISVYAEDNFITFIMATSEIATLYQASCISNTESKKDLFRIKRAVLKNCVKSSVIYLDVQSDRVNIKTVSLTGSLIEANTVKHAEYLNNIQKYFGIARNVKSHTTFNAMPLHKPVEIAKLYGSFVEVSKGICGVTSKDTTRIFNEVPNIPDLALTPVGAFMLFKCNYMWSAVENYICASNNSFLVIITQCRGTGTVDDYFDILRVGGSALEATIDLAEVIGTSNRLKDPRISYNFRINTCTLTSGDDIYTVSVPTVKVQISEKYDKDSLNLNTKMICGLLSKMKTSIVSLAVKKYFNILKIDGMTVVFK